MNKDPEFEKTLVTKENWKEYSEPLQDTYGFFEYIKANRHIVSLLGNILVKAENSEEPKNDAERFKELKNELTLLYNERKDFVFHAQNNYPEI